MRFLSATKATQIYKVFGKSRKFQKENCDQQSSLNVRNTSKQQLNAGQMDDLVVKLPFKEEVGQLGDSLQQARRQLRSLIFRLERKPELYKKYNNFINEFISLGHIEEVPDNELVRPHCNCFSMSQHCVSKDSSTTTKFRVVFDASAKTTSGKFFNDKLMVGPTVQKDLFSILIRFRMHQVELSADIARMYRQVDLEEED